MEYKFNIQISNDIEKYRAATFETKEPETIKWIQSFKDGETFYDIGANIGLYSLFAASLFPNSKIYAIEPMVTNFMKIIFNRDMNKFENIYPIYAALGNHTGLEKLYIPNLTFLRQGITPGASGSQIGKPEDEMGLPFEVLTSHIVQCWRLDDLIEEFKLAEPQHIKIDVDGQEEEILDGYICLDTVKSILIEWNKKKYPDLISDMERIDFTADNELNKLENHSKKRQSGEIENVIFTRMEI